MTDRTRLQLVRLGLVALVFNLGGGVIAPALPLYARSLGADYRDLGLIGAAHGIAYAGLTIPLGRASDRFGRRTLLLLSALAMAAATVCYLISRDVLTRDRLVALGLKDIADELEQMGKLT